MLFFIHTQGYPQELQFIKKRFFLNYFKINGLRYFRLMTGKNKQSYSQVSNCLYLKHTQGFVKIALQYCTTMVK
jgi:hypothetical protein